MARSDVCPKGHDKRVVGKNAQGRCRTCFAIDNEEARQRRLAKAAGRERPDVCDVCEQPPGLRKLAFDHSHDTGKFRGWLCSKCNTALGLANDSPELLLKLALYLERHRAADKE